MQTANKLLMVRPAKFAYNEQTERNNYFQTRLPIPNIHEKACEEFDNLVAVLRNNKIEVVVVQDTLEPHTPDSIFPNNWFSTHLTGELILYPMFAQNRRLERKSQVLDTIKEHFRIHKVIDLTDWENKNRFLEGTGSLVLDNNNRVVYACRSERTDDIVFEEFCTKMNFEPQLFNAYDENMEKIYHTNVMLSIGEKYAVICAESIIDNKRKTKVIETLEGAEKEVLDISFKQMSSFCANILEVRNSDNEHCLIMSEKAHKAFTSEQLNRLEGHCKIISSPLNIVEETGGGSSRCMIAEIFCI